jgi:hypothetical protein
MRLTTNLLLVAALAFSIGVAFASPMIYDKVISYPFKSREGPKADFSVSVIYANFNVSENVSRNFGGVNFRLVNYYAILNVTNLSDFPARVSELEIGAAENITADLGLAGGISVFGDSGGAVSSGGGLVDGVYLDSRWINVTWIPGTYPEGLSQVKHNGPYNMGFTEVSTTIPELPANSSQTGFWIGGVLVSERHEINSGGLIFSRTAIYINGEWVDVSGHVQVKNPQPNVLGVGSVVFESLKCQDYNANITTLTPIFNQSRNQHLPLPTDQYYQIWSGEGGFRNNWTQGESRLILLNGKVEVAVHVFGDGGLESLAAGKICLFASVSSYVKSFEEMVNGNFSNTENTAFELKQVQIEETPNGYFYNRIFGENQTIITDQFGVEVFLRPGS